MNALCSFETSVTAYKSTRLNARLNQNHQVAIYRHKRRRWKRVSPHILRVFEAPSKSYISYISYINYTSYTSYNPKSSSAAILAPQDWTICIGTVVRVGREFDSRTLRCSNVVTVTANFTNILVNTSKS